MLLLVPQVLPKAGQLLQAQTSAPPAGDAPERSSNPEPSSGAGELSDSLSAPEAGMSRFRRKKSRVRLNPEAVSLGCPADGH